MSGSEPERQREGDEMTPGASDHDESVTALIELLDSPDEAARANAQRRIREIFSVQLLPQIRRKLPARVRQRVSDSDILQDVFLDFFNGTYELTDGRSLAAFLSTIMLRKVINLRKEHGRARRDIAREIPLVDDDSSAGPGLDAASVRPRDPAGPARRSYRRSLDVTPLDDSDEDSFLKDATIDLITYGVTPDDAAVAVETFERLLKSIEADSDLQTVLRMKLRGHSDKEIARALDTTPRTVARKVELIHKRFLGIDASD
jgi:DNA-directed RNA polymerase specialized sigma24 family protein